MSILVYVDQYQGAAKPVSWEMLGKARELADKLGTAVVAALVIGHNVEAVGREAITYGADKVLLADGPEFARYRSGAFASALAAAIDAVNPSMVLAPATTGARDVAALAAALRKIGLAAEVTSVSIGSDGKMVAERPVFAGNITATITFAGSVQMATVRVRSFPMPAPDPGRSGELSPLKVDLAGAAVGEESLDSREWKSASSTCKTLTSLWQAAVA